MSYNNNFHHRRSTRLQGCDYSAPGFYFITICAKNREHLFGEILDGEMRLNDDGEIAKQYWGNVSKYYDQIFIDSMVVMPNHLHVIVLIVNGSRGGVTPPLPRANYFPTLGQIIGYYKYQTTKIINEKNDLIGRKIWQRNYYDRIIRNEKSLQKIRDYIINNPFNWQLDIENPINFSKLTEKEAEKSREKFYQSFD